jgi:hypothetical protein
MALDRLPRPTETSLRLTPVEPGSAPLFCFALLTISWHLLASYLPARRRSVPLQWSLRRCCL